MSPPRTPAQRPGRAISDAIISDISLYTGLGEAVVGGRGLSGDGYDDIVVSAPEASTNFGRIWLLTGGEL
ncbi:MAG: hypothetical protein ACI8RZ_004091 [Myxococcota bacterium]|jgi:hypothetical protein